MDQSVDGGDGHDGVLEQLVPMLEVLIGSDDQAVPFVAMGDQLEQHTAFLLGFPNVAQVIDDEHSVLVETGQSIAKTQGFLGALQALYERRGGHELDPDAGLYQTVTDAAGQVGFTDPAGTEQQQVVTTFHPVWLVDQLADVRLGHPHHRVEVKAAQLLARW